MAKLKANDSWQLPCLFEITEPDKDFHCLVQGLRPNILYQFQMKLWYESGEIFEHSIYESGKPFLFKTYGMMKLFLYIWVNIGSKDFGVIRTGSAFNSGQN